MKVMIKGNKSIQDTFKNWGSKLLPFKIYEVEEEINGLYYKITGEDNFSELYDKHCFIKASKLMIKIYESQT
jgi:hypothetical protein